MTHNGSVHCLHCCLTLAAIAGYILCCNVREDYEI